MGVNVVGENGAAGLLPAARVRRARPGNGIPKRLRERGDVGVAAAAAEEEEEAEEDGAAAAGAVAFVFAVQRTFRADRSRVFRVFFFLQKVTAKIRGEIPSRMHFA